MSGLEANLYNVTKEEGALSADETFQAVIYLLSKQETLFLVLWEQLGANYTM